jgi:hypothetical protein
MVPSVCFLAYRIPCIDRVVTPAGIGTGAGSLGIVLCIEGADTDEAVPGEWPAGDGADPGKDGPEEQDGVAGSSEARNAWSSDVPCT